MKKIFIGIDFSKEKFDATLIKAEGLKECAPSMHEVFDNKTSGFRRLVRWVKAQSEGLPIDTWIFCVRTQENLRFICTICMQKSGEVEWWSSF